MFLYSVSTHSHLIVLYKQYINQVSLKNWFPLTRYLSVFIDSLKYLSIALPHAKESGIRENFACRIRNPGKLCIWNLESWVLESGIQLKESGIPLTIGIKDLSSGIRIRNPRRGIQNRGLPWIRSHGVNHRLVCESQTSLTTLSWVSRFHDLSNALTGWQLISHAFLKSLPWSFASEGSFPS